MFNFWGSQDQESQVHRQDSPQQSWYSPTVGNPSTYSRPSSAGTSASSSYNPQRPFERPQPSSHISPAEAAGIISLLKDISNDELRKLLNDKVAYNQFLLSLDQVKAQNNERNPEFQTAFGHPQH